jgi:formiminoglutamase
MLHFTYYTQSDIKKLTRSRYGECKIGDKILTVKNAEDTERFLYESPAQFVLFGIPEDIGVRANYGRSGASTAWKAAVESILNLQNNSFLQAENCIILGEVFVADLMEQATAFTKSKSDIEHLRKLVEVVDMRVIEIIELIISANKIPIVIGGGHNNAYPIIKGVNEVLRRSKKTNCKGINIINCDAHTDFRALEGRHSGNGFSYAFDQAALKKYAVLGIHEQYNSETVLQKFKDQPEDLLYKTFEDIFIREKETFTQALDSCIDFCKDNYCGIELDLDAITNVPSSARTSSGISALQARQYVYHCAQKTRSAYLHIAEGAPVLAHIKADYKTGKLISYLVSDFIKGFLEKK